MGGTAYAQSCSAARQQLAAAQSGGGSNLAQLRRQYAAYGCNAPAAFGRHRACAGIQARISRGGGGASTAQIRRLRAVVARACGQRRQQRQAASRAQPQTRSLANTSRVLPTAPGDNRAARSGSNFFSSLFGRRTNEVEIVNANRHRGTRSGVERVNLDAARKVRQGDAGGPSSIQRLATGSGRRTALRWGNMRTVCVRLCDGYYFPINANSHSDNFYEELAMCVGRCPGADVSLYVHGNGSAVEGMRSTMTGEPYVRLPTAFDYRRKTVDDCSCRAETQIAGDLNAERMLASLDDPKTATDAPSPSKARMTRFKAVYDATGKPLTLFPKLGIERGDKPDIDKAKAQEPDDAAVVARADTANAAGDATETDAAMTTVSITERIRAVTDGPTSPPRPKGPHPSVSLADADNGVRVVGSTDYVEAIATAQTWKKDRAQRTVNFGRSTAVRVVPLAESAVPPLPSRPVRDATVLQDEPQNANIVVDTDRPTGT